MAAAPMFEQLRQAAFREEFQPGLPVELEALLDELHVKARIWNGDRHW